MSEKTPQGTSVGVDDPYAVVERCDHLTDDGRCRFAVKRAADDPAFAADRQADDLRCPAADPHGAWDWADCPHFRARAATGDPECARCGLDEHRRAHDDERPLLEEHHLKYADDDRRDVAHEVTVHLCRWCHAKVHNSWARIDDDASPDPEAIAAKERRRSEELSEAGFSTAAERYDDET